MRLIALLASLAGAYALRAPNRCVNNGNVALVFSDGPVQTTPELIDTLDAESVSATFMFSIVNIDHPGVAETICMAVEGGHTVGLRTNPIYDFKDMQEDEIKEAILMELTVLEEIAKIRIGYISINQEDTSDATVLKVIDELDLVLVCYNYDMYGSSDDADEMLGRWNLKLKSIRPQSTSYIVLQHDQKESELGLVPELISSGASSGFTFVNMEECLAGATMDGSGASGGGSGCKEPITRRDFSKKNSAMAPITSLACAALLLVL
ncbi:hypothetical protein NEDG_00243 [Nematocida displodere]|uniref:NodB homology domain-containing protein n=1 Tax=Nematocida displodere TaxID=1805483 RepID=A0A177EIR1_9MICR|nr:hypothetical protein NEDG_00243 [Nematocida displodere]